MFAYSIYDKVAKVYNLPFYARDEHGAMRCVMGMLSKDSQLVLYPKSYEIWQIGEFVEEKGLLPTGCQRVCSVINVIPDGLLDYVLDGSADDIKKSASSEK